MAAFSGQALSEQRLVLPRQQIKLQRPIHHLRLRAGFVHPQSHQIMSRDNVPLYKLTCGVKGDKRKELNAHASRCCHDDSDKEKDEEEKEEQEKQEYIREAEAESIPESASCPRRANQLVNGAPSASVTPDSQAKATSRLQSQIISRSTVNSIAPGAGPSNNQSEIAPSVRSTRRYPCTVEGCKFKPFTSSTNLRRHIKTVHQEASLETL